MTLAVIPAFMRDPPDLELTLTTIRTVRDTAPDVNVLVVDDCSPVPALVEELWLNRRLGFEVYRNGINRGFSQTVNVGLRRAFEAGEDAVLLNADMELLTPGWDQIMRDQKDTQGNPAAVVGALLIYPGEELIQHAGVFFSFLTRVFDHRFRYAPATLPQALLPWRCPVTGAFQYIRHDTLATVGLYDEGFRMAWEDVDFCLRVFAAGLECIYCPDVRALHHESVFRGRADKKLGDWQMQSLALLNRKHAHANFAEWVPEIA